MHVPDASNRSYYLDRLHTENRLAAEATEPSVRIRHNEMAAHYQRMLDDPMIDEIAPIPEHLAPILRSRAP